MGHPLRVLIVEDSADDADLLVRELRRGGYEPTVERVDTATTMTAALTDQTWDLVLADYNLPHFSAPAALAALQEARLDLPFIIVSGAIGEDATVAAMKAGAHDCVLKGNLTRLTPAIDRELREAAIRRDHARAEAALRESEERYALAVRGANDGVWDWNLKTHEAYFSPRWKSMLGWDEHEIGSSPNEWFNRVHPDDLERVMATVSAHVDGLTPHFESEHRIAHRDGDYRWVLSRGLAVRDEDENASRLAGSQTDITDRRVIADQLLHAAHHDVLTNLPNRALFMELLGRAMGHAKRRREYLFAVLFLDLDRFKIVNDSLGHLVGDRLLIEIARRLELVLRPGDTMARVGGDEFTILLEDIKDLGDATRVADRIQKALRVPFDLDGREVFTTASIGIAVSSAAYSQPEDLLRDADTAMYRAKALGKARHEVFDTGMHARALALLHLETDLRRAVERQEFRTYYQPIVSLSDGRIYGFEALVRWAHPDRGLVYPAEFLPVAEETGLIVPIGQGVLREACRQARLWQAQWPTHPPLSIAVNLSGRHFVQADFIEQIDQILERSGLDPRRLRLEITESAIMSNAESATAMLARLRALGIQLDVDDFGTGYSSLSYLSRLPINALKIDRSFIARMGADEEDSEIVRTIVVLAHNLGLEVIAEGVETAEQAAQLRALNCERAQGYLFSKPVEADAAATLLASSQSGADATAPTPAGRWPDPRRPSQTPLLAEDLHTEVRGTQVDQPFRHHLHASREA